MTDPTVPFRPLSGAPALALLMALALALVPGHAAAAEGRATVERRDVDDLKAVFATVESVRQATARARITGTVRALDVVEGDRVEGGRVLATVEDPKLTLQLTALDARLRSLDAQRRQAEVEMERARSLRASGTGSQARLDDAQTALDVLVAQVAAAQAERSVLEQQLAEGAVPAPSDGRVLAVKVVEGSVVMAGEPVAVIATDRYVLRLHLPERHARFIRAGDAVLVGARGLGGGPDGGAEHLGAGTVHRVYPELERGSVVADVEVAGLGDYFVGERVRVFVATGTRPALVLPEGYVERRFGLEMVTLDDGTRTVVQTGRALPATPGGVGGVEILSGLRPGDVVVRP
ncbi:efflux RND transporter periplasmic adaptor subunit [Azospirillum halopraeferens]|uniref:efflux RND transporter periplasmic adaptor subunit n=1 Tax=Azospirillum halopraeferens TaxID=34010 RepID=UPI0003F5F1E4|nr:efflux RND transporter periplasmic adaptor subunit [Azospirillum halopraeferens]